MSMRILIADDDPDIRDILKITLAEEQYEIVEAENGQEAWEKITTENVDLVLLDYKMPVLDGREVCRRVKEDILLQHIPVIMVTGKGEIVDKVEGLDAGADDYIVKPFDPQELLARIRMVLRRAQRDLEANPLTRLPGNVSILNELNRRIKEGGLFAVCYADIDKFKSYNDAYGFKHGDEIIKETARILIKAVREHGNKDDFIGHIGGDDFVIVTTPDKVDVICNTIITEFDKIVPSFYNEKDRNNRYIIAFDRQGKEQKFGLLTISIGVVTNEQRTLHHVAEIGEIGAELKSYAKQQQRSNYVKDKRRE